MRKAIVGFLVGLFFATGIGYAITVNPASNVTADSAATAGTIILRDLSNAFAAGVATLTGVTLSGPLTLASHTKAEFNSLDPAAIGEAYVCSDCTEILPCFSTGTSVAQWQRSDSPTAGCGTGE